MLFLFVGSQLCAPASFGRFLAVPPLPLANTCVNVLTLTGFTYRGLSPHKFTPVPGVHQAIQPIATLRLIFSFASSNKKLDHNRIRLYCDPCNIRSKSKRNPYEDWQSCP